MLLARQVALIPRPAALGRLSQCPSMLYASPNKAVMMLSTSAVRKDIDSAAKYIGAGFKEIKSNL
jgi:hypothetical protein